MRGRVHFEDFAVGGIGPDIGLGLVGDGEDERAVAVHTHRALAPLAVHAHELAHGQGVEKLVADHDRGPVRNFLEGLGPGDRNARIDKQFVLHRRQSRARLDEPDVERVAEGRNNARGAQRVAHQRASPGAEFDKAHRIGRAHARPHFSRPKPDQLAEHLGYFRRGGEIARRAEWIPVHVIAEIRMGERQLHVLLDRDRSVLGDHRPDFIEELRHGEIPRRKLHASIPMPAMMSGSERTMPIVSPRPRSSRRGSGSRKNSLKMRAAP